MIDAEQLHEAVENLRSPAVVALGLGCIMAPVTLHQHDYSMREGKCKPLHDIRIPLLDILLEQSVIWLEICQLLAWHTDRAVLAQAQVALGT